MEKVVITGMGTINSLGSTVNETWEAVSRGVSGVGPITLFDASDFQVKIACEVKNFNPDEYLPAKEARRRDRFEQFAAIAAAEAIKHSGINLEENAERTGVVISSAIGGFTSMLEGEHTLQEQGPRRVSPFLIPMLMLNGAAGMLAIDYGFQGTVIFSGFGVRLGRGWDWDSLDAAASRGHRCGVGRRQRGHDHAAGYCSLRPDRGDFAAE